MVLVMDSSPKVSIIIPVYNVEDYVEECLRSALNQTYQSIEIVIVNDGSTDNSVKICNDLIKEDSRASLLSKPNGGLSSARNFGLEHARGEFVFFLDGDDVVDERAIECLVAAQEAYSVDLVAARLGKTAKGDRFYGEAVRTGDIVDGEALLEMMLHLNGETGSACGKLILRSLFDDLCFPEGQLFEDFGVMARLFSRASKAFVSPAIVYGYTTRDGSITGKKSYGLHHVEGMEASLDVVRRIVTDSANRVSLDDLRCFEAFCALRIASKLSKKTLHEEEWAKRYLTYAKKLSRSVVFAKSLSLSWRLRCILFGVSSSLYRAIYKLYGKATGKVVG